MVEFRKDFKRVYSTIRVILIFVIDKKLGGKHMKTVQDLRGDVRILGPDNAKRDSSTVKNIVRHHSATETGDVFEFQEYWSDTLGWKTGAYHEIILRDGTVQWNYFDDDVVHEMAGYNTPAYHICLVGNEPFTQAQEKAFYARAKAAMDRFNLTHLNVLSNNEFTNDATDRSETDMNAVRNTLADGDGKITKLESSIQEANEFSRVSSTILDIITEVGWAVLNKLPGGSVIQGAADLFLSLFTSTENTWEKFINHVEELINARLDNLVKSTALSELDGIGRVYNSYVQAFKIWEHNKTAENANSLMTQFIASETYIRGRIQPAFNVRNFEVNLVTVYTQAANIHLSILSDAVERGAEWGFNEQTVDRYYDSLKSKINEHTNHCYKTYQKGLESMEGNRFVDWCFYNRYRREMTIAVLDISAAFSNYDCRLYPVRTKTQLTREIQADFPLSRPDLVVQHNSLPSFQEAESTLIKKPHLFDYIDYLEIFTSTFANRQYWSGHNMRKSPANGLLNQPFVSYGRNGNSIRPFMVDIGRNFPCIQTLTSNTDIRGNNLLSKDGASFVTLGRDSTYLKVGDSDSLDLFPKITTNNTAISDYSNFLSDITFLELYRTNQVIAGALNSWVHTSTDLTNTLDTNAITQIPWIKARNLGANTRIIPSKGLVGNHFLLNLGSTSNRDLGELVVRSGFSSSSLRNFYIRIRYAAPSRTTGQLLFNNNVLENNLVFSSTFSSTQDWEDALDSQEFLRFTNLIGPIVLPLGVNSTSSFNLNVSRVYIDQIEFIPAALVDKLNF